MKLYEFLIENGISQKFFAKKIGYCQGYLNSVVKGHRKPGEKFKKAVNAFISATQPKDNPFTIDWD